MKTINKINCVLFCNVDILFDLGAIIHYLHCWNLITKI